MIGQFDSCWTNVWFTSPSSLKIFAPLSSWCHDKFYQEFRKKKKGKKYPFKFPQKFIYVWVCCQHLDGLLSQSPNLQHSKQGLFKNGSFTLKALPIHQAHSSSYLRLKFMSMKGRLAQNIYILVGGRTNSPFPVGALKVVSSRFEGSGWGCGGDMRLWYSKAPTSTSQTARVHSTLGKSPDSVAPVPLWQPWNVEGGDLGQHEPCWLRD